MLNLKLRNICGLLATRGYNCKERNESINLEERTHKGTYVHAQEEKERRKEQ